MLREVQKIVTTDIQAMVLLYHLIQRFYSRDNLFVHLSVFP